jgi:hypothetical protein
MVKNYFTFFFLAVFVSLFLSHPVYARESLTPEERQMIMDREMGCITEHLEGNGAATWKGTCLSNHSAGGDIVRYDLSDCGYQKMNPEKNEYIHVAYKPTTTSDFSEIEKTINTSWDADRIHAESSASADNAQEKRHDYSGEDSYYMENSSRRFLSDASSLNALEMGAEASYIRYEEPDFMKNAGYMAGVFAAYTHRTSTNQHIKKLGDIFSDENKVNMYRLDGKLSFGQVDYTSQNTGEIDNIDDYMFEIRGTAGYDIPISDVLRLTPYLGFGFRHLNDDSGGRASTTGHLGYERESRYFYAPIGLETQRTFQNNWTAAMVFEYDLFLDGTQKSHLGDAVSGIDTVKNDQDKGYGLRGSFKLTKQKEGYDVFVEPFVRYWNIEDSDLAVITYSGSPIGLVGQEPANNSTEYGVKLGVRY